jgi:hypothetical protein
VTNGSLLRPATCNNPLNDVSFERRNLRTLTLLNLNYA